MISVVIPTHNRIGSLENALASVFRQTKLPQEVVVVDDGSAKSVTESVFSSVPPGVACKLFRHDMPKGGNAARNKGIVEAAGQYIAFLDDDDEFEADKIEVLESVIREHQEADVFYHPAKIKMLKEKVVYCTKPKDFSGEGDVFRSLLVSNCIGGTPMVTVKRDALLSVGMFDTDMPALQDYELWLRLAKSGRKFTYIDMPLTKCTYTTKKKSVSKSIESNCSAIWKIESKYVSDIDRMSNREKKCHEIWKRKMVIHKCILNGDQVMAIGEQCKLILKYPGLSVLLTLVAILLGPKMVFRLRSWIG